MDQSVHVSKLIVAICFEVEQSSALAVLLAVVVVRNQMLYLAIISPRDSCVVV